jgi:hypothetical protein
MIPGVTQSSDLLHAYLAEGDETVLENLLAFLEQIGITVRGNPDVQVRNISTLTIEESRALKAAASRRGILGRKYFIMHFKQATREAQNALLKLFEDPTQTTHLFIVVPTMGILLPTLRSRVITIPCEKHEQVSSKRAEDFLKASQKKRLDLVKDIIETKDKHAALLFLNELEAELYKEFPKKHQPLKDIELMRSYLHDRAPSMKIIFEHLALSL